MTDISTTRKPGSHTVHKDTQRLLVSQNTFCEEPFGRNVSLEIFLGDFKKTSSKSQDRGADKIGQED